MMIRFDQSNGDYVVVNPALVKAVKRNHGNDECALIVFGKDDYISVIGTVHDVGYRISMGQAASK